MTSTEKLDFSVTETIIEERIGRLIFANPKRRHALSTDLLLALSDSLEKFSSQRLPVVILTSIASQDVWSAGFDIGELVLDRDPLAYGKPLEQFLQNVRSYPGVVIAMVSGSVWGGAVDLAMSCDLVIADHSAKFAITPANIGLPYSTSGLLRFMNNLPIHVLKEMFFCAKPLDAEQAKHFGVINHLVDNKNLESMTLEIALDLTRKAPMAVQAVKEQLRILEDFQPIPVQAMEKIAALRLSVCDSVDFTEGLDAFLTRRQPEFGVLKNVKKKRISIGTKNKQLPLSAGKHAVWDYDKCVITSPRLQDLCLTV